MENDALFRKIEQLEKVKYSMTMPSFAALVNETLGPDAIKYGELVEQYTAKLKSSREEYERKMDEITKPNPNNK